MEDYSSPSLEEMLALVGDNFALRRAVQLLISTNTEHIRTYCAGMVAGGVLMESDAPIGHAFRAIFEKRKLEILAWAESEGRELSE